jgi:glutathione synthase/RimK-type ligase-like ATP-grasp enzyme
MTTFPKVFKLRGGAGSTNVKLVKNKTEAMTLANKAFGKGFSRRNRLNQLKDRLRYYKKRKNLKAGIGVLKGIARVFIPSEFEMMQGREKGYIYFQDFIENNSYDTRVIVVKDKCFAIRRYNRENDFRASGSGILGFDQELFDDRCLQIAFDVSEKLGTQSIALDFIFGKDKEPYIVEISYGFTSKVYMQCPGYWDKNLNWHQGKFSPQYFMIEDIIESLNKEPVY